MSHRWRVLCLGNELLADDALGYAVANRIRLLGWDVVYTSESGLNLIDHLLDVYGVVVVDTVITGAATPGTIHVFGESDLEASVVPSLHYVGLPETIRLGRALGLPVAEKVVFVAVEAADCSTIGGEMHPAVKAAIPVVVERARRETRESPGALIGRGLASRGGRR